MTWLPDDIADLTSELRALLNEWDPIGVADIVDDEYDGLNGEILAQLAQGADLASFTEYFLRASEGFSTSLDESHAVAARLHAWFHSKQPGSQAPPGRYQRPQLRKPRRWRSSHWKG